MDRADQGDKMKEAKNRAIQQKVYNKLRGIMMDIEKLPKIFSWDKKAQRLC